MSSIPLVVSDPGTFQYTEGQTYYNELLAHAILTHAAAMAAQGYELSFGVNVSAWTDQTTTLTQHAALLNALEDSESLDAAWKTRLTSAKSQVAALLDLDQNQQNFNARDAAIAVLESLFQSVAGVSSADIGAESEDLLKILKAAFLKETVPDSNVYTDSVLDELKAILQSIQELAATENVIQCPHTGHYIYTKTLGKKTV